MPNHAVVTAPTTPALEAGMDNTNIVTRARGESNAANASVSAPATPTPANQTQRRKSRRPVFKEDRQMDLRQIPLRGEWLRLQRQITELPILAISSDRGTLRWENEPDAFGKWGLDP